MPPRSPTRDLVRDAITRGAWTDARAYLESASDTHNDPHSLEELGLAGWWLDDAALVFDSRERAYALYRDRDDARGAARMAVWLTWDYLAFRGDFAVASGWLERARRLLDAERDTPEYGWLLIREGELTLFRGHAPHLAIEQANAAAVLGRTLGDRSIEFTALALEGLARVSTGEIAGGMRCLDEASLAATAGEMRELHAVGVVCCWQIFACERVRDYDRAAQWCERVQEFCRRWGLHPLSAVCRSQYAGVLIWRGEWRKAEEELTHAAQELERVRPGMTATALARLGRLRLRQGNLEDAARLFAEAGPSTHARIGLGELMLERGDARESAALLEQLLEQIGESEATLRAECLELAIRAHLAGGSVDRAMPHLTELEHIAMAIGTDPMLASLALARAGVRRAGGDLDAAVVCLEGAVERFDRSGAPFETASARLQLAEVYLALGRAESAQREARLAEAVLAGLGAETYAKRAKRVLDASSRGASARRDGSLTPRQLEILRFIAAGMSNGDIAGRLALSEHTVKRHVANLLLRLEVPSRAAAAAYAAREGLV